MSKPTECIFSYADASVYMGQMVDGKRHGRGTLRTAAFVYCSPNRYTQDDAIETARCAKWHEYNGEWANDKMHGCGAHLCKSGDGNEIILFQGEWVDGCPQRQQRPCESGNQELDSDMAARHDLELEIFGY